MAYDHEEVLSALSNLQKQELSIIRLSEPIATPSTSNAPKRASDISCDAFENPSPASLGADLTHYKELFSKLRFSYLEQVTKERFLRAIVGDPPHIIEHQDNVELETQLVKVKADLKLQKIEVGGIVEELEANAKELSRRYDNITLQTVQLSRIPGQISKVQESLATILAIHTTRSPNASMSLPLPATHELLSVRQAELNELNQQLKTLQQTLPRKTRERERMESELKPLQAQKSGAVSAAKEAQRRKEDGEKGIGDDLELKGRWYTSVETGLKEMLGVEG